MTEYYRAIFSVARADLRGVRLLESVRSAAREWIQADFGSVRGDSGKISESERGRVEEGLATFRILWERRISGESALGWRMSARFATEGGDVEADVEIFGIENRQSDYQPQYFAAPPSVPHRLLDEFDCRLDGRRMSVRAARIAGETAAKAFINDYLYAPNRRTPIVAVSAPERGDLVDADNLQKRLLGAATVVAYDSAASRGIARYSPLALRCADGEVRVYSPGCLGTDRAFQNPRLSLEEALRLQEDGRLWRVLRDECVNRVSRRDRRRLYVRVCNLIEELEREAYFQTLVDLENQIVQNGESNIDPEFYEACKSLDESGAFSEPPRGSASCYRTFAVVFRRQRDSLEDENKSLKEENEALKAAGIPEDSKTERPRRDFAAETREFKTVKDAVAEANTALDDLRFFPTAFESAERSQFQRPAEVYRAFEVLSECAKARGKGTLRMSVTQWLENRSVDYAANESEPTEHKYRDERTFGGVFMPAHVKIGGNELRIHLVWDESAGKWLIGHVGAHLPTARHHS